MMQLKKNVLIYSKPSVSFHLLLQQLSNCASAKTKLAFGIYEFILRGCFHKIGSHPGIDMSKIGGLSTAEWEAIAPILPYKSRGVARSDDRKVIGGILWVLRNACPWRQLPAHFGPHMTCYNRFSRWQRAGIWDDIEQALATVTQREPVAGQNEATLRFNSRAETTRSTILASALKLFALGGFDGVSTRLIAAEASVPPASLRYYFKDKQGLYDACLSHVGSLAKLTIEPSLIAAEALLAAPAPDSDGLISAYCTILDGYADFLLTADNGNLALFIVRHDLPTLKGSSPDMSTDAFGARLLTCQIRLIRSISERTLRVQDAMVLFSMIQGQLTALCTARPRMENNQLLLTAGWLVQIKRKLGDQTAAILRQQVPAGSARAPRI